MTYKKLNQEGKQKIEERQKKMIELYGGEEHLKNKTELFKIYKEKENQVETDQLEYEENKIKATNFFVDTKKRE